GIKNKLLEAAALGMSIVCTRRALSGTKGKPAVRVAGRPAEWARGLAGVGGGGGGRGGVRGGGRGGGGAAGTPGAGRPGAAARGPGRPRRGCSERVAATRTGRERPDEAVRLHAPGDALRRDGVVLALAGLRAGRVLPLRRPPPAEFLGLGGLPRLPDHRLPVV